MAVAFVSTITAWGGLNGGAQSSGSFNPTTGNFLAVVNFDGGGSGFTLLYSGTLNTPIGAASYNDTVDGNTLGIGGVNAIVGGVQTLTVNSVPGTGGRSGYAWQYSGVVSTAYAINANYGVTSAVGNAVTVPVGAILLACCIRVDNFGGSLAAVANGGVTPTTRGSGANGTEYCAAEYVGAGGSITPTFTVTSGDYIVLQVLMGVASTNVTVGLTGSAATASPGTVAPTRTVGLTGSAATASAGTLTPTRTVALVGSAAAASPGTVSSGSSNVTVGLTGSAVTASPGSVAAAVSKALTGQAATSSAAAYIGSTGYPITVVGTPDLTSAYRITASPDIVSGVWIQTSAAGSAGATQSPAGLSVLPDATWQYASGATVLDFDVRIYDPVTGTWGVWATQFVGVIVALTGQTATSAAGSFALAHSVALIGQALAASADTLTPARTVALVGSAGAASPGSLAVAVSRALSGAAATVSPGALLAAISLALTGQAATAAAGNLTANAGGNVTVGLTGAQATASAGTLAYSAALQLVGAALAAAAGTITASSGGNVTVGLTGAQATAALGSVGVQRAAALVGSALLMEAGTMAAQHAAALLGQTSTAAAGTLTPEHAAALSGAASTMSTGTVALLRALALLGIPATVSQGTVGVQAGANVTVGLTGAAAATAAGTITVQTGSNITVGLTGILLALAGGTLTPEMRKALTGSEAVSDLGNLNAIVPVLPFGGPLQSIEGAFASNNPRANVVAGTGALVAGANGCILGRFVWVDQHGHAGNARLDPPQVLGFSLAQAPAWGRVYWSYGRPVLRAGLNLTVMSGGDFWARFESGAQPGAQVYARLVDGAAISGYATNAQATPWYVVTQADPGELAIISTWSKPPT